MSANYQIPCGPIYGGPIDTMIPWDEVKTFITTVGEDRKQLIRIIELLEWELQQKGKQNVIH